MSCLFFGMVLSVFTIIIIIIITVIIIIIIIIIVMDKLGRLLIQPTRKLQAPAT
jgi:hypothetical protein